LVLLAASSGLATCGTLKTSQPAIEPEAEHPLRAMCSTLASAKSFEFSVTAAVDEMTEDGQRIQASRQVRVLVRRPDAIATQVAGDGGPWLLRYSGKTLAVMREDRGEYATSEAPATVDAMLDFLFSKYGVTIPLADLLFADPYASLTERVESGMYVGRHSVNGTMCHHLLFTQGSVDWQIWIDTGAKPLPRKVVITRKNEQGAPEYVAEISDWNLAPSVSDETFSFKAPAGAQVVDMAKLCSEKGNEP
jgi:hypothetical protein